MKKLTILIVIISTMFLMSCQDRSGVDIDDVDLKPVVRILSPKLQSSWLPGSEIEFSAEFYTLDEEAEEWTATWESDLDGLLFSEVIVEGNFSSFSTSTLSDSVHIITVSFSNSELEEPGMKHVIVENNLPDYINYDQFSYLGQTETSQYFISEISRTWEGAKSKCDDNQGHQVTITSEDELNFLKDAKRKYDNNISRSSLRDLIAFDTCWLGLSYNEEANIYEWVNGEVFEYYIGIDDNYYEGEFPENPGSGQPYVYINSFHHMWYVSEKEIGRRFILEIEQGGVEK